MIKILREQEEVMLYGNVFDITEEEDEMVIQFLSSEYDKESLNYPGKPTKFEPVVALWAAKICYYSAQFLLYRQSEPESLEKYFEKLRGDYSDPNFHISADLCLRFIPQFVTELKMINSDDKLIELLESILKDFPLSAPQYISEDSTNLGELAKDYGFAQQLADKIIPLKKMSLINEFTQGQVNASLGAYKDLFWKNYSYEK
jgi:hypothetical protein